MGSPTTRNKGWADKHLIAFVEDPNGYKVELIEMA